MEEEKGNFRGELFGGFNRNDVINYIESAAAQFNATEKERDDLAEEKERLAEELDELKYELEAQKESASADLKALAEEKDGVILELRRENARLLEDIEKERARTFDRRSEELDSAAEAVDELIKRCGDIKADMAVNVTNTRRRILDGLEGVESVAGELEKRLNKLRENIDELRAE